MKSTRSMVLFLLLCIISLQSFSEVNSRTSECMRVKLPRLGTIVGRYLVSHDGRGIRAFMGIPYAEPPVGNLRFKDPHPKTPWTGELEVKKDSPICIQRDPFRRDMEIEGSEDCLYLNVYAPHKPKVDGLLPVMIFFHGGGWQCGSGISAFYGPDFFMDHDVILIGANFRLGPLGFMSTGRDDCPGNFGLKDQVMALRWIQENIESFGGDPKAVTVFGESAGGASATYHMMSPLSKGLFQKAISQSGTNLNPWAQPAHRGVAESRAKKLGAMMGCVDDDTMIECLRKVPAANITAAFYDFFEWDTDPMIPFPPVVEHEHAGAFITKHPRDEKQPWALHIPWITGITFDEGVMKTAAIFQLENIRNDLLENWDRALPIALNYNHHSKERQEKITKEINKFYFNNKKLIDETKQNLTNLFTDGWFLTGMDEYLKIRLSNHAKNADASTTTNVGPTYVYLFAHKGESSFTEIFKGGGEEYHGVSHAEELQFMFPIGKELFISAAPSDQCTLIRKGLTKMWTDFAKTGNPTPSEKNNKLDDNCDLPKWHTTSSFPLEYMRIGMKEFDPHQPVFAMEKGLMDERAKFWHIVGAHLPKDQHIKDEL